MSATTDTQNTEVTKATGKPDDVLSLEEANFLIDASLKNLAKEQEKDCVFTAIKSQETQQIENPFENESGISGIGSGETSIIDPPLPFEALQKIPAENNIVKQCIDAMVTNIECTGTSYEYIGPENQEETPESTNAKDDIEDFLDQPNADQSLMEIRKALRTDLETFGNMFAEVVRDVGENINSLYHLPCQTMRLCKQQEDFVEITQKVRRRGKFQDVKRKKRFRLFAQKVGAKIVYFKEFGDPRIVDAHTGKIYEPGSTEVQVEDQANEVIWHKIYFSGEVYGLPRYVNQLPAIKGSREAELVNLQFFRDNAIPALAILVNGGKLTNSSVNSIINYLHAKVGREAVNKILLLEAKGDMEGSGDKGTVNKPDMELVPLNKERQSDELFQVYDDNNRKKVQSSFKLPDILIGRSSDYNRATSKEAITMAEAQVFSPERSSIDEIINKKLLLDKEGTPQAYWKVVSNPTRVVSPDQVSNLVNTLERVGGISPNVAIELANKFFGLDIPRLTEKWADYPFTLARELVKKGELAEIEDLMRKVGEEVPEEEVLDELDNIAEEQNSD